MSVPLIVGIVLLCLCCPIVGIGAAVVIPAFTKFGAKSKQGECKANLHSAITAEKAYFAEHETYSSNVKELQFEPWQGNRYAYYFAAVDEPDTFVPARYSGREQFSAGDGRSAANAVQAVGIFGECPKCEVTIVCVGNVDTDDALDVWSISTGNRRATGKKFPAGTLVHHRDDIGSDVDTESSTPEISK